MDILWYGRLSARVRKQDTRTYELYYRATQIMHNAAMDLFKIILPAYIIGAEGLIVASLFLAIRLGVSPGFLFILIVLPVGLYVC